MIYAETLNLPMHHPEGPLGDFSPPVKRTDGSVRPIDTSTAAQLKFTKVQQHQVLIMSG